MGICATDRNIRSADRFSLSKSKKYITRVSKDYVAHMKHKWPLKTQFTYFELIKVPCIPLRRMSTLRRLEYPHSAAYVH